jgi:hypothetical protein
VPAGELTDLICQAGSTSRRSIGVDCNLSTSYRRPAS